MEIIQSIVLGIVQGLAEFLPISSTAHLVLVPFFAGWEDPGLAFDVALHAGTLISVLAFFWRDWMTIIRIAFKNPKSQTLNSEQSKDSKAEIQNQVPDAKYQIQNTKLLWLIVIATIPGALAGYFFEVQAETVFRSPLVIAFTLSFVGLLLYLADKHVKHRKNINQINLKDVIIIGLTQAAAIIPGVSRSGATITSGLMLGLSRVSAARFSFLLSTPIILGATLNQLPGVMREGISIQIIIGIIISAISGYLAIKYLLKFVERVSYKIFFWYRLVLAILIVLLVWI